MHHNYSEIDNTFYNNYNYYYINFNKQRIVFLHLFHGSGLTGLKLHIIISSFLYKQRHYPLILVSHPLRISRYSSQIQLHCNFRFKNKQTWKLDLILG